MIAMAAIAAIAATGCKSQRTLTEAVTVASPAASQVEEVTTVTRPATPVRDVPKPQGTDRQEKVTVVGNGLLKDYNVVVGSFGKKENAEGMVAKMTGRGYQAFMVQNEAGMYRVVAGSYDTREAATPVRDKIRSTYADEAGTCAEAWLLIPMR